MGTGYLIGKNEEREVILKLIENEKEINKDFPETDHKTKKETKAYNEGWKDALESLEESVKDITKKPLDRGEKR